MQGPETRASLIYRLNDPASAEAWSEFAAIYRPIVIRVARAKGLQHADAEDLAQDVMAAVERSLDRFTWNGKGSFRRWLYQITRNLVVNRLTRQKGPVGSGDSDVRELLEQHPAPGDETATLFRLQYRRARFRQAAEAVRGQFSDSTWQCFWMTAVEGVSADQVAGLLDKTPGAVRVARCRVMTRLREEVQHEPED